MTGPRRVACDPAATGWRRAGLAFETILHHEVALLALALYASRRWTAALWAVPVLALAEMLVFAVPSTTTFSFDPERRTEVAEYLAAHPSGDDRILDLEGANNGLTTGESDLWGYDPGLTRRYGEFMAFTQNIDPDEATQDLFFRDPRDLYATLLRCRAAFGHRIGPEHKIRTHLYDDALVAPHAMLVPNVRVIPAGRDVLHAMVPPFDPRNTVLLERAPAPAPAEHPTGGTARTQ